MDIFGSISHVHAAFVRVSLGRHMDYEKIGCSLVIAYVKSRDMIVMLQEIRLLQQASPKIFTFSGRLLVALFGY